MVGRHQFAAPASEPGLNLGVFGQFYPAFHNLANATTALTVLLSGSPRVRSIHVFCQPGALKPPGLRAKVTLHGSWEFDDPVSIARAFLRMFSYRKRVDAYILNLQMTCFGRRYLTNGIGLALSMLLGLVLRGRVVTYMHNLLDTQDVVTLGYTPGILTRLLARILEKGLLTATRVIVPSVRQANSAEATIGRRPGVLFIPGLEFAHHQTMEGQIVNQPQRVVGAPFRVLLFGSWGPQKDLAGACKALQTLVDDGIRLLVTVAGGINTHFSGYDSEFSRIQQSVDSEVFNFVGPVAEETVQSIFRSNDVLVLPYNASGGYSGVMNVAVPSGIPIVSYDIPELRDQARDLNLDVTFVTPHAADALEEAVRSIAGGVEAVGTRRGDKTLLVATHATLEIEKLVRIVEQGLPVHHPVPSL